jgi:nucleoside-diphosphate-sugar epimerase
VRFTVFGATGFIGAALVQALRLSGREVLTPTRYSGQVLAMPLGHVIYAAGVTSDFRERPFDALEANTCVVADILRNADFETFLYLSSARVYRRASNSSESSGITLNPEDPEDLYDFTKLAAEAVCHASGRNSVRIVRLTNVVGPDFASRNFLSDVVRSACLRGEIVLRTDLDSAKDYVLLDDVVRLLPRIAIAGRQACYNLGSGENLTNRFMTEQIAMATGARVSVIEGAPCIAWPRVDISRLQTEFDYCPGPVLPALLQMINEFRKPHDA